MKKLFFVFLFILFGIAIVLSLLDMKGDYVAGKKLWKINKEFSKIALDPQAAPSAAFDRILKKYGNLIQKFPESPIAPIAQIHQGQVYLTQKDYVKARQKWEEVLSRKNLDARVAVTVLNKISQSYLIEKNYKHAIGVFDRLIKNYPLTSLGIQAPLLKSVIYKLEGDEENKEKTLVNAVSYYKGLVEKHKDTKIEFIAQQYLIEALFALNRWKESVDALRDILMRFPDPHYLTPERARWIILRINVVSEKGLKNLNIASEIYGEFIKKYPQHPLNATLKDMIKKIQALETKQQNAAKS